MTETSKFWTGIVTGDAGPYSADQFADYMRNALMSSKADYGPFMGSGTSPDFGLTTQQSGTPGQNCVVTPGAAHVRGYYYENSANLTLAVVPNVSGNPRIDTVVLRATWATQTVRLAVLQGTPAGSPVPPTLTQNDGVTWEIPLADIAVANGFTQILNANITPRMNWANQSGNVMLYDVQNLSGGALNCGDVVTWTLTASVLGAGQSTTLQDPNVAGVWVARTPINGYGRLLVKGIGYVFVKQGMNRGALLTQSNTAKQADVLSQFQTITDDTSLGVFGITLQNIAGPGLVLAYIDTTLRPFAHGSLRKLLWLNGADYSTSSAAFSDVDTTNLILNFHTVTGRIAFAAYGACSNSTANTLIDMILDGVTRYGAGVGAQNVILGSGLTNWSFKGAFTGLAPGVLHSLKLQFATGTAATAVTLRNTVSPIGMLAWEI